MGILIACNERCLVILLKANMRGSDFSPISMDSSEALLEASKVGVRGIIVDSDLPDCELSLTLKALRAQSPHIPILVTHTSDDPHDIQLAFEHGATWVVTKPYDPREILDFFLANPTASATTTPNPVLL